MVGTHDLEFLVDTALGNEFQAPVYIQVSFSHSLLLATGHYTL